METALVELKQKYFEEEKLRVAYNDLVTATKSLEAEMEDNMTQAQAQVDKVSKKYNALVEKCNELQDKFVNLSVEQERIQMEVMNERAERESLQAVTVRVSDLTVENENTNQLYFKATQDALDAKQELEGSVPKQIRN
jgi:DNA repair exonuclease SbcCD ATPase subunit